MGRRPESTWLLHILDTIDEGIHAVDLDGVTIFYNKKAGQLDGLAPSDVVGRHVLDVFPSLESETSTLLQVLRSGQAILNQPQTYTNFLGVKVHTVNTTLPIVSDGTVVGALEVAKDMTQVRRLSEQVLALQAQVAGGRRKSNHGKTTATANISSAVYRFSQILTQDERLLQLKERAARAAQTTSPILIYGETGTGKELLVQSIHNASPRKSDPFLALNCAALPASLLEGILFGTVRGSFTGAEDRPGLFELANEGTLFLDEIQSMPMELQAKLLRVLQEGELMRVGDTRIRRLEVRVIAAMNTSPEQAVAEGTLRQDLYYRIHVVRFDVPALRDRRCDLDLLTHHFIDKWNKQFHSNVQGLTERVQRLFQAYPWPGNVRELENAIEAALNLVHEGFIDVDCLPGHLRDWAYREGFDLSDPQPIHPQQPNAEKSAQTVGGSSETNSISIDGPAPSGSFRGVGAGISAHSSERTSDVPSLNWPEWTTQLHEGGFSEFWAELLDSTTTNTDWRGMQTLFERMVLEHTLEATAGNVKAAAARLGIPRQTLQYRISQLEL